MFVIKLVIGGKHTRCGFFCKLFDGKFKVLDNLTFTLPRGTAFGFIEKMESKDYCNKNSFFLLKLTTKKLLLTPLLKYLNIVIFRFAVYVSKFSFMCGVWAVTIFVSVLFGALLFALLCEFAKTVFWYKISNMTYVPILAFV